MQNGTQFPGSRLWESAEIKRLILPFIATVYGAFGATLIILFWSTPLSPEPWSR